MDELSLALEIGLIRDRLEALESRIIQQDLQIGELVAISKIRDRPVKASAINICALDETRDSAECPDATVYRHQQGCRGVACVRRYTDYYSDYRKRQQEVVATEEDTVG